MLERILTAYYDEIFRYCYHHVGSRETAEDLCQDTFVSFLEHQSDYPNRGKTKNYLYTIARNKCIDYYRKAEPDYMDVLPESTEEDRFEETVVIKDLVEKLPDELKEVIILRFFQGLKYREIAGILGIGVSKAKYLTAKALEVLVLLLITATVTALILLISAQTKSTMAAMAAILVLLIGPAFLTSSKTLGWYNHLIDLFAVRFMDVKTVLGSFVDYRFGGFILDYITMGVLVYAAILIGSLIPLRRIFVRRVMKG